MRRPLVRTTVIAAMASASEHSCRRIAVNWQCARRPLTDSAVRRAVRATLDHARQPFHELSIVFVNDAFLCRLHAQWLDDPSPTDVISFDLSDEGRRAGELYISVPCARRLARERGVRTERELALYIVHGVLHLCGWDDHEPGPRARMRRSEAAVLGALGYEADSLPHP